VNEEALLEWLRADIDELIDTDQQQIAQGDKFETTEYTQPVKLGIDAGSKTVGISATAANMPVNHPTAKAWGLHKP
jgi:hypothetical protein